MSCTGRFTEKSRKRWKPLERRADLRLIARRRAHPIHEQHYSQTNHGSQSRHAISGNRNLGRGESPLVQRQNIPWAEGLAKHASGSAAVPCPGSAEVLTVRARGRTAVLRSIFAKRQSQETHSQYQDMGQMEGAARLWLLPARGEDVLLPGRPNEAVACGGDGRAVSVPLPVSQCPWLETALLVSCLRCRGLGPHVP